MSQIRLVVGCPASADGIACSLTACAANLSQQTDIVLTSSGNVELHVNGETLRSAVAICKFLALSGANSLLPSSAHISFIEDVMEMSQASLEGAVHDLDARLADQKYLTGDLPTLADLITWARFYPAPKTEALHVLRWFSDLGSTSLVSTVLSTLGLSAAGGCSTAKVSTDVAWDPDVPQGHTSFTWGKEAQRTQAPAKQRGQKQQKQKSQKRQGQQNREPTAKPDASKPTVKVEDVKVSYEAPVEADTTAGPKVPVTGQRNVLITSALPYVNNVPHLGNIIGCVLSADVYSRFCRLRGHNCIYICGTDEYGTATEIKALQQNTTCQKICDKYHAIHKGVYDWFNIDFDHFGRTTTKHQTIIAQDIFNKCDKNGMVTTATMDQLWCEGFGGGKFLADRFVGGECPKCHFEDASGDQCDACGALLNAAELIKPFCKMDPSQGVEIKPSDHLMLDLPKITPALTAWIEKSEKKGNWTSNSIHTTHSWLNMGLKERCITRDLDWGTPVPKADYDKKVFYVWFDAPIGYMSITANYTDKWEEWWKNPDNVELVQFMGKDNVPFHTVIFPSSLLASGDNWTMLHHINTTEYLNFEGGKFSKRNGVGVFGDDAESTGIGPAVWRYYLLANRPEQSDTMFTWKDFAAKNNTELLNNLGNFVNRSLTFTVKHFETVPDYSKLTDTDATFVQRVHDLTKTYVEDLEAYKIKNGLQIAMRISKLGNTFMQENAPWELVKPDKERCGVIMGLCVNLVYHLGLLLQPYMPSVTASLSKQLGLPIGAGGLKDSSWVFRVASGHKLGSPELLFRKIPDEEVEALTDRFKGPQSERGSEPLPIQLLVGKVKEVKAHPEADKLYVLQIDLGEEELRQVVSGLVGKYEMAELQDKTVVVLSNAKSSKLMGVKSNGMLMMGVKDDVFGLLTMDEDVPLGTRVQPEGGSVKPKKNFNIKKELHKLDLTTGEDGTCLYAGMVLCALGKRVYSERVGAGGVLR